jgi:hypothetical protein
MFRAITTFRPARKSAIRRDIRRVITPHLEPSESIEICAVLYSGPLASASGAQIGEWMARDVVAIRRNRNVQVYYAAVTGQRVLMVEVSWYVQRPRGLALSDSRQGASLLPRTKRPAESRRAYADVQYRGPSGQVRTLWYNGYSKTRSVGSCSGSARYST